MPVLVLTADATQATRQRALSVGASDFLSKPLDPVEVRLRIGNLLTTRRLQLELVDQNKSPGNEVRERTRDLEHARLELLERLALAAEYRDDNTQEHAQRVGRTTALIAEQMGLPDPEVEVLLRAAALHAIDEDSHHDRSADTQRQRVRDPQHSRADRAQPPRALGRRRLSEWPRPPRHPAAGRMVALADVFDALVHERAYKQAWPVERAVTEIVSLTDAHFDPEVVEAFRKIDHAALLGPTSPSKPTNPAPGLEASVRR